MLELLLGSNLTSVLLGALVFICAYLFLRRRTRGHLPPGPMRLPLLGTTYQHGATPEDFLALGQQYGDICTAYLGPECVIVLNNYPAIHEALVEQADVFVNRGYDDKYCRTLVNPGRHGILMRDYDDMLHESRKTFMASIRELGVGRGTMEVKILKEVNKLVAVMKDKHGKAVNYRNNIATSTANIIMDILLNVNYDHGDKNLADVIRNADNLMASGKHVQLIDNMPILRFFPPFKQSMQRFFQGSKALADVLWSRALAMQKEYVPGQVADCFVDKYLEEYFVHDDEPMMRDQEQFKFVLRDLLLGGFETTNTSLKWTILFLANRQDKQKKLHEELDKAIGRDRDISMSDRINVPYLRAVISEVQRLASVVPYFTHQSAKDTNIFGFDIPKDTYAFINFYSIHMNENTWGDPREFRPERFIGSRGQYEKNPHVVPFAMGKRVCPGQLLAKQELFLFVGKLFQEFVFLPPEDCEKICEDAITGFTRAPMPYQIRAVPR